MRVLMVTKTESLINGVNRHIIAVASALNRLEGVDVAVVSDQKAGDLTKMLRANGVKAFPLGGRDGHSLGNVNRFRHVLQDFRPDVIHVHELGFSSQVAMSLWAKGTPVVKSVHGLLAGEETKLGAVRKRGRLSGWRDRIESVLRRLFAVRFQMCCYISEGVRRAHQGDGVVIYNPVSFAEVPKVKVEGALRALIGVSPETPVIGTACRIAAVKNLPAFARVACHVLQKVPVAHAVVIGSGDEDVLRDISDIVSASGVGTRFHLLGYRADAPQLIREFSLFMMTSYSEGLPTALLEAMSSRTPISFMKGAGGLEDLWHLNETRGPIAIVGSNEIDFAESVYGGLQMPEMLRRNAEHALALGREIFDVRRIALQLAGVYGKVCAQFYDRLTLSS